jgi:hypothetical protein
MEKSYEVKVYNKSGTYLTTWKDIVSDISYSNEINTSGGSMVITLARNAGDYGEGSDVDFGHRVVVTCFDTENPDGLIVFQGMISGFTPIYKDNKVDVSVLGYGSELSEHMVEVGDSSYLSQLTNNVTLPLGYISGKGGELRGVLQSFTIADASKVVNSIDLKINTSASDTVTVYINADTEFNFSVCQGSASVGAGSGQTVKVTFDTPGTLVSGKTYYILVYASNSTTTIGLSNANPYAGGSVKTAQALNYWYLTGTYATYDIYFNLYAYGGNTKKTYTAEAHTDVLSEVIDNYISRGGHLGIPPMPIEALVEQQFKDATIQAYNYGNAFAQAITPLEDVTFNILQLAFPIYSPLGHVPRLYQGDPSLDGATVTGGTFTYDLDPSNTLIGELTYSSYVQDNGITAYFLTTPITLQAGIPYYIVVDGPGMDGFPDVSGSSSVNLPITASGIGKCYYVRLVNNQSGGLNYSADFPAMYIRLSYAESMPGDVNGGYADTGTNMTYTINVQTALEVINVIKDLAPENWYWFIDQGSLIINFKEKADEPEHIFTIEKDILDASFDKRIEGVINTIYFTGGDTGGGDNLYLKYENADSISKYGVKSIKYNDSRVTSASTANIIAENILATKSEPELRVTLEILDSNNNQGLGYDLESLKVGDVIAVRNVTQQVGLSTWDVGRWDEAYWDYNVYNLSSLRMQITKITIDVNRATINASTMPVDVSKRIEEVNRGLETLQILNNPVAPS